MFQTMFSSSAAALMTGFFDRFRASFTTVVPAQPLLVLISLLLPVRYPTQRHSPILLPDVTGTRDFDKGILQVKGDKVEMIARMRLKIRLVTKVKNIRTTACQARALKEGESYLWKQNKQ